MIPPPEELPANTGDWVGLDAYIDLIQKCWAEKPEDRPDFKYIVAELRSESDFLFLCKTHYVVRRGHLGPAWH